MAKPMLIADRRCTTVRKNIYGRTEYESNCYDSYDSKSNDLTGFILVGLGFLIVFTLIFKKLGSNNSGKSTSLLLEEYVLWYQNNKDDSVSIGNSYLKGDFLIIKDKFGTILDEVNKDIARKKTSGNSYLKRDFLIIKDKFGTILDEVNKYIARNKTSMDRNNKEMRSEIDFSMDMIGLKDYIKYHNKNNDKKADLSNSRVLGGFYILNDANGKLIKKVDLFDAESEISNDENN